jgi:multiple sugar transport system substrate-binding protein
MRFPRALWVGVAVGMVAGAALALGGVAVFGGGPDDPLEPGELVILSGQDDSPGGQRQALVDLWNALNPQHQARIDVIHEPTDGQRVEMLNRDRSTVDVYNLDVTWTAEFAKAEYIQPIDEARLPRRFVRGFLDKPLITCRYNGALWALPFNTDAGLVFYRSDLVQAKERNGLPSLDWTTITEASRQVPALRAREPRLLAGYAGQLNGYEGLTVNGLEAIWAAGATVVNPAGQVTFDAKAWQAGLSRLAVAPAGPDRVMFPDSLYYDESLSRDAFRDGKVMFMRNWPIAFRDLSASDTAGRSAPVPFQVAQLPGPSVLGGQNLAIARDTKRPNAARALIQFLTGEPSQRMLFERGGFAATQKSVYADPSVQKDNPYVTVLRRAIEDAGLRPVTPFYANFSKQFQQGVGYALQHGGAVEPDLGDRLTKALRGG